MTSKGPERNRRQSRLDFDPPLHPSQPDAEALAEAPPPDLGSMPLFPDQRPAEESTARSPTLPVREASRESESPAPGPVLKDDQSERGPSEDGPEDGGVTLASRFLAGLADLAIHGAVVVLLLAGQMFVTSKSPSLVLLPAYGVFLLAFSFLYTVVPLAFWGQTPGMSAVGLQVRAADGENLTFPQTAMRWAIGLLTCALLGIPLLVATSGKSLGDRLSRSVTLSLNR